MLQEDDVRRAQLVAAAEALVGWIHSRRATWPTPTDAEPSELAEPGGLGLPAAEGPREPLPEVAYETPRVVDQATRASVKPRRPEPRLELPTGAIRSLGAPVLRWSVRLGAVAALVALAVGAVSIARPLVLNVLKLTATPKTGTAVLESVPPGSQVLVDGTAVGTTPMTTELATGHHVVEFRRRNATRKLEIDVAGGASTTTRLDWNTVETGRLLVRSEPAGARVVIDGRERGVTPLTLEDLSLGSHVVVITGAQGSIRRTVAVTADRTASISESIFPGFLKLFAPFDLEITEGARAIRLDDQNQVLLPAGSHELRLVNRALGYAETRTIDVLPGQTTSLSIQPPSSTLTVTANEAATVTVDGEPAGDTPLTDHAIALGTRDIIVKSASGTERRFTTTVTTAPVRLDVTF